jgi:hypothetical protein
MQKFNTQEEGINYLILWNFFVNNSQQEEGINT